MHSDIAGCVTEIRFSAENAKKIQKEFIPMLSDSLREEENRMIIFVLLN